MCKLFNCFSLLNVNDCVFVVMFVNYCLMSCCYFVFVMFNVFLMFNDFLSCLMVVSDYFVFGLVPTNDTSIAQHMPYTPLDAFGH